MRFGCQPLAFGHHLTLPTVLQLHIRQATRAQQREHGGQRQGQQLTTTQSGAAGQILLQLLQAHTQRLAVSHDGSLRLACGYQSLQVAQDGASLNTCLLVALQQHLQPLAYLRVTSGHQPQFVTALEQTVRDLFEGDQVFAEQEHGLGAHSLQRQELVGRLADALRQHHQLTGSRDFSRRRVLLQLEGRNRLSDLQQV